MHDRVLGAFAVLFVVGLALGLTAIDAIVEQNSHVYPEFAMDFLDRLLMLGTAIASTVLVLRLSRLRSRTHNLEDAVRRAADEGRAWRAQSRRFIDGLSQAIDAQFEVWCLTPSEADVAGLLLKGASVREIATLRRTSEATIRQQAQSVYRKSGLASRTELSAYFLEDLFGVGEATIGAAPASEERYDA